MSEIELARTSDVSLGLPIEAWIMTQKGARQIRSLLRNSIGIYADGDLSFTTTDGFVAVGHSQTYCLQTCEGYSVRLASSSKLLKVGVRSRKRQPGTWIAVEQLEKDDRIAIHNHRGVPPWEGKGSYADGLLVGNVIGSERERSSRNSEDGQTALDRSRFPNTPTLEGVDNKAEAIRTFGVSPNKRTITERIEEGSYKFYQGFLRGLFNSNGVVRGDLSRGICIRLLRCKLSKLQATQRMLLRLGIASSIYRRYYSQASYHTANCSYELAVSNDNLLVFKYIIGFESREKQASLCQILSSYKRMPNSERFTAAIDSLELIRVQAVYGCTVPGANQLDSNGFVVRSC